MTHKQTFAVLKFLTTVGKWLGGALVCAFLAMGEWWLATVAAAWHWPFWLLSIPEDDLEGRDG